MIDRKYIAQCREWYEQHIRNIKAYSNLTEEALGDLAKQSIELQQTRKEVAAQETMLEALGAYVRCCELLEEWEMWPESNPKRGAAVVLRKALEGEKP